MSIAEILQGLAHATDPIGCWLVGFSLFGSVLLNVSVCAGSLASGCWFPGHVLQANLISQVNAIIFGARNCRSEGSHDDFGSLGAPCEAKGAAEGTPWGLESVFL